MGLLGQARQKFASTFLGIDNAAILEHFRSIIKKYHTPRRHLDVGLEGKKDVIKITCSNAGSFPDATFDYCEFQQRDGIWSLGERQRVGPYLKEGETIDYERYGSVGLPLVAHDLFGDPRHQDNLVKRLVTLRERLETNGKLVVMDYDIGSWINDFGDEETRKLLFHYRYFNTKKEREMAKIEGFDGSYRAHTFINRNNLAQAAASAGFTPVHMESAPVKVVKSPLGGEVIASKLFLFIGQMTI